MKVANFQHTTLWLGFTFGFYAVGLLIASPLLAQKTPTPAVQPSEQQEKVTPPLFPAKTTWPKPLIGQITQRTDVLDDNFHVNTIVCRFPQVDYVIDLDESIWGINREEHPNFSVRLIPIRDTTRNIQAGIAIFSGSGPVTGRTDEAITRYADSVRMKLGRKCTILEAKAASTDDTPYEAADRDYLIAQFEYADDSTIQREGQIFFDYNGHSFAFVLSGDREAYEKYFQDFLLRAYFFHKYIESK